MHCFKRAAFRFSFSRTQLPASRTPTAPFVTASRHAPRSSFQRRWASDDAPSQHKSEEKNAKTTVNNVRVGEGITEYESTTAPGSVATNSTEPTTPTGSTLTPAAGNTENNLLEEIPHNILERPQFRNSQRRIRRKRPAGFDHPKPNETVFVGNIFFDVTADDLRTQMEKYGIVEHATIICDSRGMSKGYGYVTFDSVDSAARAIEGMHLQIFEGRNVYVDYSLVHKREQPSQSKARPTKTLYISNLGYEMTDRDLNELFKDIENIIDVRITVNRRTGQLRGYIHVEFLDTNSAQMAMEALSRKAPYGRKLLIEYSGSKVFRQDDHTLPGLPRLRP